jgi:chromosome segregation protein
MRRKIDRLRAKLEEIGGIDESVVKEYQETEARHSFLTAELADLKQAQISLRELIKELEKHVKEDFKKGFAKIKDEFHNYFRIIFGGGRATLQLVDIPIRAAAAEDEESALAEVQEEGRRPTVEGIDINIDLPRKRIKGLAMLSGGERALTAIALLFSITAVSPPPFLMLDETDAALDEANSQRYGAILKELSQKTQLLLVTHNRETMKSASVLYGVTMGDDGVSKMLSLKLEEAEVYTNR